MAKFKFSYHQASASLRQDGALIPVTLTAPERWVKYLERNGLPPFATRRGFALIDTGADRSAVDATALAELEIPAVGVEPFLTTHGIADLQLYNLSAMFPDLGNELISLIEVPGGVVSHRPVLDQHIIMLLGRDLLQHFVLTYDGPSGTITLSR